MRKITFQLISLGSELPDSDSSAIAEWIKSRYGKESDLISWAVEETIKDQTNVTFPCAGGDFYRKRVEESLSDDLSFDMTAVSDDILTARRYFKDVRWSLPSPSDFAEDDSDEAVEDITKAFSKFFRDMRDLEIPGHVLLSDKPTEIELEEFSSRKFLWVSPTDELESILERSRDIVIDSDDIDRLESLFDSYNIRYLYIKDAGKDSLKKALEMFDSEYICIAGNAPSEDRADYWKKLSEVSVETSL